MNKLIVIKVLVCAVVLGSLILNGYFLFQKEREKAYILGYQEGQVIINQSILNQLLNNNEVILNIREGEDEKGNPIVRVIKLIPKTTLTNSTQENE